jgi:hypothetical protein
MLERPRRKFLVPWDGLPTVVHTLACLLERSEKGRTENRRHPSKRPLEDSIIKAWLEEVSEAIHREANPPES